MRLRKHFEQEPKAINTQRVRSKSVSSSIASSGFFVPILTGWGAALLGLVVIVLPASVFAPIAESIGMGTLGGLAKYAFAVVAALIGAGLTYGIASTLRKRALRTVEQISVASVVSSRLVQPINPAAELGSDSLDAPIDKIPFGAGGDLGEEVAEDGEFEELYDEQPAETGGASLPKPTLGELSKRGYDIEDPDECSAADEDAQPIGFTRSHFRAALIETCEGATCEASPADKPAPTPVRQPEREPAPVPESSKQPLGHPNSGGSWSLTQFAPQSKPEAVPAPLAEKPRALDLSEFAQIPGRNGVWVEEEAAVADAPHPKPRAVPAAPVSNALNKLRQTPTEDLSLVQMVERFAGALHEHQEAERTRLPKNTVSRDAALAEALKALTLFTERGFNQPIPTAANAADESDLGQTERELREALVKLQTLRGAA